MGKGHRHARGGATDIRGGASDIQGGSHRNTRGHRDIQGGCHRHTKWGRWPHIHTMGSHRHTKGRGKDTVQEGRQWRNGGPRRPRIAGGPRAVLGFRGAPPAIFLTMSVGPRGGAPPICVTPLYIIILSWNLLDFLSGPQSISSFLGEFH